MVGRPDDPKVFTAYFVGLEVGTDKVTLHSREALEITPMGRGAGWSETVAGAIAATRAHLGRDMDVLRRELALCEARLRSLDRLQAGEPR